MARFSIESDHPSVSNLLFDTLENEPKIIEGIRYRDSTDYISTGSKLRYMSLMGGAELAVDGSHMHEAVGANVIKFHSDWPADDSVFVGPPPSGK